MAAETDKFAHQPCQDAVWPGGGETHGDVVGNDTAKKYTGNGYAKEAVAAFLPVIMKKLNLKEMTGVCLKDNIASSKVMEAVGFVKTFDDIAAAMGCADAIEAVKRYKEMLKELDIVGPKATSEELDILASSVNASRLKNNPVALSKDVLYDLYQNITQR